MGTGDLAGPRSAEGAEVLHESARTRTSRLRLPTGTVILKEALGPEAASLRRREITILKRLRGIDGVAQLMDAPRYQDAIVLADAGETTLAGVATPLAPEELHRLTIGLTRAVAGMHRRGVLHRDINPGNIVLSADGQPTLISFGIATWVPELRPEFTHYNEILGTLAYLAPESTGRTGRPVDQRADLYALGATLYELATGTLPFPAADALTLIHDLLARVPVPPAECNSAVPEPLSQIILHLLEKEPDRRYQSAEGLLHDLQRLVAEGSRRGGTLRVGAQDLPLRLLPPSRLIGREETTNQLEAGFEDALAGRCRALLVAGAPGVGKTALIDQLRPIVTRRDGWFVAGKFDQYRRDLEFDAVAQAFRALGRLLLAEPEDAMTEIRDRLLAVLGANARLASAVTPEFAALLGVAPAAGDPLTAPQRAQRNSLQILRAVASRERPLVLFVDDLQWAGRTPLGLIDLVVGEEPTEGLLLVGAYREDESDVPPPLAAFVSRWREQPSVRFIHLHNLSAPSLGSMVAEMLRVDPAAADELIELVSAHTSGNPYETVELLNGLRSAGLLTATADGWHWDGAAVRAHLGVAETETISTVRLAGLPPSARAMSEAMACLGGSVSVDLLQTATGQPSAVVGQALAPTLENGLLVAEPGDQRVLRFRHDRLREAVLAGLDSSRRRDLQLGMARRLAAVPKLFAVAADQYLSVLDAIEDPVERRAVVRLLRRAADEAALTGDHARVNLLLSSGLQLIEPADAAERIAVQTVRHVALYGLGRLEEADEQYRVIEESGPSALELAGATVVQVYSLTHRNRPEEALELATRLLRELGIAVPSEDRIQAEVEQQFDELYRWLEETDGAEDPSRQELSDPALLAAARLLNAAGPAAYFADAPVTYAWLCLKALHFWINNGPSPDLLGVSAQAVYAVVVLRGDYAAGYRGLRRLLAAGEAHGYEPTTSQVRFLLAQGCVWLEPLENAIQAARAAREGLLAGGDLANTVYSYYPIVSYLLDCAPRLDSLVAEVDAGLEFVRRTGNQQIVRRLDRYRWLVDVLRGQIPAAAEPIAADGEPLARFDVHLTRAVAAVIFGDLDELHRHTAAAILVPNVHGLYPTATAHVLRGVSLCEQIASVGSDERAGLLSQLDEQISWLTARALEAPDNFSHLVSWLEAERAWAIGDPWAAAFAFDAVRRQVVGLGRPWHRALITERAARFHLAHGLDQTGYELLARARDYYGVWGATAKVAQLDWAYPVLQPGSRTTRAHGTGQLGEQAELSTMTSGTVDLLGILSASQALSSETSLERLHARVVKVLGALTGATAVHLLLWDDEREIWVLPTQGAVAEPVAITGDEIAGPLSVLRYAQRTGEALVVADATADDRFSRDPYFADTDCCSLLVLPIFRRGAKRAVLVLENRLLRGAFTADRLDAVALIASQLAVSLDNARLYAELTASRARIVATADATRRRIERDLHDGAQQRLVSLALRLRTAQFEMPQLQAQLADLAAEANGAVDELRELARGLHPAALARGGLPLALPALARQCPIPVRLDVRVDERLPDPIELAAYYVVAEALTNSAKHAQATAIDVEVHLDGDRLFVRVRDDGCGGAGLQRGSGLLGLKDRIEALGGLFAFDSPPESGTVVETVLPLDEPSRAGEDRDRPPDADRVTSH